MREVSSAGSLVRKGSFALTGACSCWGCGQKVVVVELGCVVKILDPSVVVNKSSSMMLAANNDAQTGSKSTALAATEVQEARSR